MRSMEIESGLQDGQILQRLASGHADVLLCGRCPESGRLRVTIRGKGKALAGWKRKEAGQARRGRLSIKLEGLPAGGPYELILEEESGRYKAVAHQFYVGDVWILAGQSNMEGAGHLPGFSKPHPLVRAFSQRREWRLAEDPLHVHVESPDACHNHGNQISPDLAEAWRKRAPVGAGAGIPFGKEMFKRTGVPQGLICVARGGSPMSLWDQKDPAQLYASMLASIRATGQPVAGMLWYQGESDTSAEGAEVYTEKMKSLVAALRHDLRQPRLPWIMVQLARVFREGDGLAWNSIQDQQRLLPSLIPHLECVAAIDLPLDDEIHISAEGLPELGRRLAFAADRLVHGNRKEKFPPRMSTVRRALSTEQNPGPKCGIDVGFDGIEGDLKSDGEVSGFCLVSPEGKEIPWIFKTTLHGNFARLHIMRLPPEGTRIAYGRGFAPRCNIRDGRGLALPVFAPQEIGMEGKLLPFVTNWRRTPVVGADIPFHRLQVPKEKLWEEKEKNYESGFIDEHNDWQAKTGYAFFTSSLELDEPQTLQVLMGYDGPFRMWLDGKPFFHDPRGCNPCIADQSGKVAKLSAGNHEIVVAIDINYGQSWGFFLRFAKVKNSCREKPRASTPCIYGL